MSLASRLLPDLSLIKQHIYNTTIMPETLTRYQEHLASLLETDSVYATDMFRHELEGYGVDNMATFEDAYYGCYPSVDAFVEDFINDCYHETMRDMPDWLANAIDYELIWHQSFRHDFFEVSHNGEVYIFNRNF